MLAQILYGDAYGELSLLKCRLLRLLMRVPDIALPLALDE